MEWLSLCSAKSKSLLGMCCKLCNLSCAKLQRPFSGSAVSEPILLPACTFRAALPRCFTTKITPGGSKRRKTCLTGNGLKMSMMPRLRRGFCNWFCFRSQVFLLRGVALAAKRQAIGVLATEIHIPRNSSQDLHPRSVHLLYVIL